MGTNALHPGTRRAEELKYVTAHLIDMQGMTVAPFLLTVMSFADWVRLHGFRREQLWFLAAGMLVSGLACWVIARSYRSRYGFVQPPDEAAVPSGLTLLSLSGAEQTQAKRPRSRVVVLPPAIRVLYWVMMLLCAVLLAGEKHPSALIFSPISMLLLPRWVAATPQSGALQLRRALAVAVFLPILFLNFTSSFAGIFGWTLFTGASFSFLIQLLFLVLVLYDHWLLEHFLGPRRNREAASAG